MKVDGPEDRHAHNAVGSKDAKEDYKYAQTMIPMNEGMPDLHPYNEKSQYNYYVLRNPKLHPTYFSFYKDISVPSVSSLKK